MNVDGDDDDIAVGDDAFETLAFGQVVEIDTGSTSPPTGRTASRL